MKTNTSKTKFEFTITGLILSVIIITMFSLFVSSFISGIEESGTDINASISIDKYNHTQQINEHMEEIRNATNIDQQEGILDVIGGYFTSGYSAMKIAFNSFSLFNSIISTTEEEFEPIQRFTTILMAVITIGLIMLLIGVLVKMRI